MSKALVIIIVLGMVALLLHRRFGKAFQPPPGRPPPRTDRSTMSRAEALAVLGLESNAQDPEIIAAHRRLMQKIHPDHGGTNFLAQQLNEAKKVLLS